MTSGKPDKDRRGDILAAAQTCFADHGYAATTVDAIAGQAGLSKGSVYNYFRDKQDLLRHVFTELIASIEGQFTQVLKGGGSATDKLSDVLDLWYDQLEHLAHMGRLMLEFWAAAARETEPGEFTAWFDELDAKWRQLLGGILRQGVDSGEFQQVHDVEVSVSLLESILDGIMVRVIVGKSMKVDAQHMDALKDAILTALRASPPRPAEEAQ